MASIILVVWAGALSAHAWRTLRMPAAERLATAARVLPPGESWFALYRGEERAGWARRQLDTLPLGAGFVLRERSSRRVVPLGAAGRHDTDLVAWLNPGGALDSLAFVGVSGADTTRLEAMAMGDSVVVLRPGGRIRVAERPQLAGSWPLRFAADSRAREVGRDLSVVLLDPATASVREVSLVVRENSTRIWADSADTEPETGRWIAVRQDTIEAWRLDRIEGSVVLPVWVDVDGRVVEAEEPGGLRYQRTAFELAFFRETELTEVPR